MVLKLTGLSEFQKDLFDTAVDRLPKEIPKLMRSVGSRGKTRVSRQAKNLVGVHNDVYHKRWKRGKVFKDAEGKWVVRVINSSPHAHLIEDGHRIIRDGKEIGYSKGLKPLEKGWDKFEKSNAYEKAALKWLDKMLKDGKL